MRTPCGKTLATMRTLSSCNLQLDRLSAPRVAFEPMIRSFLAALAVPLLLVGCERPNSGPPPSYVAAAKAFADLVHPPGSQLLSTAAGTEAAEANYTNPAPPDSIAAWYRRELVKRGFELERESVRGDGSIVIYARKQREHPLWVTVRPAVGGPGTSFTLVGVVPADTVASHDTTR